MSDKDLLELAAKAAGIDLCWNDAEAPGYYSDFRGMPQWEYWNPLVFDGAALRLAVQLRLDIHFEDQPGWVGELVEVLVPSNDGKTFHCTTHALNDDAGAAVRRAIVESAAEIGRESK